MPDRPNARAGLTLTADAFAIAPRSIIKTPFTKTRFLTKKMIGLPTVSFADETACAVSTSMIVSAGILTAVVREGLGDLSRLSTGGPFGAIFMASITVSGTPRRFKSRRIGGKTSKLQVELAIVAIMSTDFRPSSTILNTSPFRNERTSVSVCVCA